MSIEIIPMGGKRPYPPRLTEFTTTFWKGLEKGQFLISRCDDCAHQSFPPKKICPHCWSRKVGWIEHPGQGVIYSQTTVHAAPAYFEKELPFQVCVIDLHKGPRVATRLIGGHPNVSFNSEAILVALQYADGMLFAARSLGS